MIYSHWIAYVCQDCRQVITDLRTLDGRYPEDCLTVADLCRVLIDVESNRRHEINMALARSLADDKGEYLARIADYQGPPQPEPVADDRPHDPDRPFPDGSGRGPEYPGRPGSGAWIRAKSVAGAAGLDA